MDQITPSGLIVPTGPLQTLFLPRHVAAEIATAADEERQRAQAPRLNRAQRRALERAARRARGSR